MRPLRGLVSERCFLRAVGLESVPLRRQEAVPVDVDVVTVDVPLFAVDTLPVEADLLEDPFRRRVGGVGVRADLVVPLLPEAVAEETLDGLRGYP